MSFTSQLIKSRFDQASYTLKSIDMHTAGEPLRVIYDGFPTLNGKTILAKRQDCLENHDQLRKLLMLEPRGHADMYGALLVEPTNEGSDFGVLFIHNEGYSTMCGHAILALAKLAVASRYKAPETPIVIDTPAGKVIAQSDGELSSFINVASFVAASSETIELDSKKYCFDIAFGGAFYAFINADLHDIDLSESNHNELKRMGKALKGVIDPLVLCVHPTEPQLSFLYGVIFYSDQQVANSSSHSKHVCIFADGELDRSPTGTGVSARAALLYHQGELPVAQSILIESILGHTFTVQIEAVKHQTRRVEVSPKISGCAFITGQHTFMLDPSDPIQQGFLFK
ncbi:Not a Proline racemase, nor 4-hydroxyproline epimerase [missing catalytic residues] [Pseudoalteromonas luteoviolacea B = ATCC 29581]|nr:Not a Proline racemase, nor 4-hydroxyproline epimerase [missing catalytic residues] [Pseudoalteromonas luteoviolacea B = ATCC 29581]